MDGQSGSTLPRRQRDASDYSVLLKSVQSLGLLERRYLYYVMRSALLLLALAGCWAGFALIGDSWLQLGIAAVFAVVLTQIIFLSHDAAHRQIFKSAKANEIMALVLGNGISGMSLAWWNNKHNRHHQAPNQIGKDPDIRPNAVVFYPSEPAKSRVLRFMREYQGWWFLPLLVVEALNLHTQSVVAVFTRKEMKRRHIEMTVLIARLTLYPAVLFVFLSPGIATAFIAVQMAVTGVYLGSVFAPAHVGMPVLPHDLRIDFLRRQVLLSRNIISTRFTTWLMGGLNYQVEHHLFPSMPRPNLRRAKVVVESFCEAHNVVYTEKTLLQAWVLIIRHMNKVGAIGRDPFECPLVASLRPR
jgi:fatty acid desaturase